MKVKAKSSGGDYEKPEPGNQAAVLVAIVELGTVEREYKGERYEANDVLIAWELTTQEDSTKKHPVVGRTYTLSFGSKSNLRKMVEKWMGKPIPDGEEFDLARLLGGQCLLDVGLTDDEKYIRLDPLCVSKLPKGMSCPPSTRKPEIWEIAGAKGLPEHLNWLPFIYGESVQDRIKRSNEWKERTGSQRPASSAAAVGAGEDNSDEILF